MFSHVFVGELFQKNRFDIWFYDDDTIYDNLDLLVPLISAVMVWCDFSELIPKITVHISLGGPYLTLNIYLFSLLDSL